MISYEEALARTLALFEPLDTETVPLTEAPGRVIAAPVAARRDQPPFPSSAMDGYAVTEDDARQGRSLRVIGDSVAGRRFPGRVGPGEAVRVFTGAPVPEGAARVVVQEDVTRTGGTMKIDGCPGRSKYVRPAGSDFTAGTEFPAPTRLGPAGVSLLASMNAREVRVHRSPSVALIATGDELVAVGDDPGPDQIVSSNNLGLKALVEAQGATARLLPIAPDTEEGILFNLRLAQDADVIVTLGGASVGDHDLVKRVACAAGLETAFQNVALRPGKPVFAGSFNGTPLLGLPGNPVSAIVCGHVFLRPAIDAMLGLGRAPLPTETAILGCEIGSNGQRRHFMSARADTEEDDRIVRAFGRQDSSLLSVLVKSNALLVRPPGDPARNAGETVDVVML